MIKRLRKSRKKRKKSKLVRKKKLPLRRAHQVEEKVMEERKMILRRNGRSSFLMRRTTQSLRGFWHLYFLALQAIIFLHTASRCKSWSTWTS